MRPRLFVLVSLLTLGKGLAQTPSPERVVESLVPWMAYNSSCSSSVKIRNLGNRAVDFEVEAHKSSGALAPFVGRSGIRVRLNAGENAEYKLQLTEETTGAWVRVRETIPLPELSPVLAVSGATECLAGDALHTTERDIAWPTTNPWFSGDVRPDDNGVLSLINTSEHPARVSGCYSSGVLYSVPRPDGVAADLTPVCSGTIDELIPPFGSRQYPPTRGGATHFSLKARGEAIVLQMLRPANTNAKVFQVDSTITFGNEVPRK